MSIWKTCCKACRTRDASAGQKFTRDHSSPRVRRRFKSFCSRVPFSPTSNLPDKFTFKKTHVMQKHDKRYILVQRNATDKREMNFLSRSIPS